ncbi:MAG: hypothetical protein AAFO78_00430 [Pseudomonadota bacterium]
MASFTLVLSGQATAQTAISPGVFSTTIDTQTDAAAITLAPRQKPRRTREQATPSVPRVKPERVKAPAAAIPLSSPVITRLNDRVESTASTSATTLAALLLTPAVSVKPSALLPAAQPLLRGADFLARETALRREGGDALDQLVLFYLDHGLAAEASTVLKAQAKPLSPMLREAQWTADFLLDRCVHIITDGEPVSKEMEIILASCFARLGHYENALRIFDQVLRDGEGSSWVIERQMDRLHQLPQALLVESLIHADRLKEAGRLLRSFTLATSTKQWQAERLSLNLAMLGGQPSTTPEAIAAIMRQAEDLSPSQTASLRIQSLRLHYRRDMITHEDARAQLSPLLVDWRGGTIEREALMFSALLAADADDVATAFSNYRRVLDKFPDSDAARIARSRLQDLLGRLFADNGGLSLLQSTALFYENIDLLAPGAAGDAQIRAIAERLVALDLLTEAAELLDHQAFARLRGAERAAVATALAQIHLDNDEAQQALEVLQRSRITGLSATLAATRRQLEARALWKTGRHGRALARLDRNAPLSPVDRLLKATILSDMGDNAGAQPLFFADAVRRLSVPVLLPEGDAFILRAMIATVEAGQKEDQILLVSMARARLAGRPVMALIEMLDDPAQLSTFPGAYRAWLAQTGAPQGDTDPGI